MNELEDTNTQLEKISKILEECDNYDLTPEVVYFALKEMQMNFESLTISDSFSVPFISYTNSS